jgi:predicted nucleic acid-binding protein
LRLFYLDASALIKRYSSEPGSSLVNELFQYVPPGELTCATIGVLEIVSILVRKRNDGRLPEALFFQAMANFRSEVIDSVDFSITSIDDSQMLSSLPLIVKHNLNATDAILLRSAMDIERSMGEEDRLVLWTSDQRLARAADSESLSVFDPETDTRENLQKLFEQ